MPGLRRVVRVLVMDDAPHQNLGFECGAVGEIGSNRVKGLPQAAGFRSEETHESIAVRGAPGSHVLKKLEETGDPAAYVGVAVRQKSFQLVEGDADGFITSEIIGIADQASEFIPLLVMAGGIVPDLRGRKLRKRAYQLRESAFLIDHMDLAVVS
jgi:hypothetical protein